MKKALFLYTEIAPYFMACVERLVKDHEVEVHIVRWPVNKEAPFEFIPGPRITIHERRDLDDAELLALAARIDPDIVFSSGWVDKGYLKVCRAVRRKGRPSVMCSDTAWRGDQRQQIAVLLARFWLKRTFSHAWATGSSQALYASRLGFRKSRIRRGFYSADVERFAPLAAQFAETKANKFPHRFLCVARYIATKGQQDLCDAFAELCDEERAGDWDLWLVGTGELQEQVQFSKSGSHGRIKHLGFVQAHDVPKVMEQCGVFVLPSSYEPWGVVVHEHACAGFPLILSSKVGASEMFLREGANGQRFFGGSVDHLKVAMRWIISRHDDDLVKMGGMSASIGASWDPGRWADVVMELMSWQRG